MWHQYLLVPQQVVCGCITMKHGNFGFHLRCFALQLIGYFLTIQTRRFEMKQSTKALLTGLAFTWWAVISVIIGSIIRNEYLTEDYYTTFNVASVAYAFGWIMSVFIFIGVKTIDEK